MFIGKVVEMRDAKGQFIKGYQSSPATQFKKGKICGENHPKWKGGRRVTHHGYILIYAPDHPGCDVNKEVLEHRIVMERKIGRYLNDGEVVHHINGIRGDNRIENLVLCKNDSRHHKDYHKGDGIEGYFKKGHIPWNKGMKGFISSASFKKGHDNKGRWK